MKMNKKLKKLTKILEEEFGWIVYVSGKHCENKKCYDTYLSEDYKFCPICGAKLKKRPNDRGEQDLKKALDQAGYK